MNRKGVFDWIIDVLAYLAGILLGLAVVIKFADIILRYFLNRPLTWDIEVTEYILFSIAFLGTAWLLREGGHVRIDVLDGFLSKKGRVYLHLFHSVIGASVSIILTVISLVAAVYSCRDDLKVTKIYTIDKYYFLLIIFVGYLLMLVEFLRQIFGDIGKIKNQVTD